MFRKRKQKPEKAKKSSVTSSISTRKVVLQDLDDEDEEESFMVKKKVGRAATAIPSPVLGQGVPLVQDNLFRSSVGLYTEDSINNLRKENVYIPEELLKTEEELSPMDVDPSCSTSSPIILDYDSDVEGNEFMMPTTHAIERARKKREQVRTGAPSNFIPLDLTDEHNDSVLVRENIEDEDIDPFTDLKTSKIQFGDPGRERMDQFSHTFEDIDDDDDDAMDWEKQQLQKMGIPFDEPAASLERGSYTKLQKNTSISITKYFDDVGKKLAELKSKKLLADRESSRLQEQIQSEQDDIRIQKEKLQELFSELKGIETAEAEAKKEEATPPIQFSLPSVINGSLL